MMMKRNGENRARNEAMMSFFGVLSIAAKGSTRREEDTKKQNLRGSTEPM